MAATYEALATTTLGSATNSVLVMSSIPSTYTDLVLVVSAKGSGGDGDTNLYFSFNGTTSGYSLTRIIGNGTSATSARTTSRTKFESDPAWYLRSSMNNVSVINIMNYSNTSVYKTVLSRHNQTDVAITAEVGLWANTAAVSSITVSTAPNNFAIDSTFTLYGIKAA